MTGAEFTSIVEVAPRSIGGLNILTIFRLPFEFSKTLVDLTELARTNVKSALTKLKLADQFVKTLRCLLNDFSFDLCRDVTLDIFIQSLFFLDESIDSVNSALVSVIRYEFYSRVNRLVFSICKSLVPLTTLFDNGLLLCLSLLIFKAS